MKSDLTTPVANNHPVPLSDGNTGSAGTYPNVPTEGPRPPTPIAPQSNRPLTVPGLPGAARSPA